MRKKKRPKQGPGDSTQEYYAEEEIGGYIMLAGGPITHQFVGKHQIYEQ